MLRKTITPVAKLFRYMKTSDFSIGKMIWMEVLCVIFGTFQPILRVEIRLHVCLYQLSCKVMSVTFHVTIAFFRDSKSAEYVLIEPDLQGSASFP